ncbi:hypothetical protein J8273_7048 [Carpediemonas membranifera]|uniref:Uncharacterized protein n=1 Tax=Carpediemonas membranifera TaxID=201153 RepID=A0A8J6AT42_9EUKA|nr:hypothetical protein J8273_7048 [Carpediemonas membranifera]|eukprot:KAG9390795.1 hypothetical protein J8273_7048 [Carpediemonas membranifera]
MICLVTFPLSCERPSPASSARSSRTKTAMPGRPLPRRPLERSWPSTSTIAISFVNRIVTFLSHGPPLSMNVELAPGQELPVALHTLNQGAVWACLLGGGANPDLKHRLNREIDREIFTAEAKCLWFLCRKFFFSWKINQNAIITACTWADSSCSTSSTMQDMALKLSLAISLSAMTRASPFSPSPGPGFPEPSRSTAAILPTSPGRPRGWGDNNYCQLGFGSSSSLFEFLDPTRLTFPACLVAELETSLPPWEKHRMATDVSLEHRRAFILTPDGTVMAGWNATWYVGPVEIDDYRFHPVAVPAGFVPDHIMHTDNDTVILTMGDRRMIGGNNAHGELGLGHKNRMTGFVDLPFRVDRIMAPYRDCNLFLSGRQLLFAGRVPNLIVQSGLLPGCREQGMCLKAIALRFPQRVKGFFTPNGSGLTWVTEGQTHLCKYRGEPFIMTFEANAGSNHIRDDYYRDPSGQWFWVSRRYGKVSVAKIKPLSTLDMQEIIPVDPWTPDETGI